MTDIDTHLVVVVPPELADGFRLAGVTTYRAQSAEETATIVERLIDDGERGVIAVYEPLLTALPTALREHLEYTLSPIVVGLPSGLEAQSGAVRRARLAGMLQRAVGYHITFGAEP